MEKIILIPEGPEIEGPDALRLVIAPAAPAAAGSRAVILACLGSRLGCFGLFLVKGYSQCFIITVAVYCYCRRVACFVGLLCSYEVGIRPDLGIAQLGYDVALLDSGLLCAAAGSDRPDSCTLNQIVILGNLAEIVCTETPRAALPVT